MQQNYSGGTGSKRVFVLGLDGVPFSFMKSLATSGDYPNFARLFKEGFIRPITTAIPTVSSVAWTSFITGKQPGKHGIYGFSDRTPGTYDVFITTSRHVKGDALWDVVGRAGKKSVVINLPQTYPPKDINGVMVSGFLTPSVEKACRDAEIVNYLKAKEYRIDVDPVAARGNLDLLLEDIRITTEKRTALMFHLLDTKPWDFFLTHFMVTDRLHHFMWEHMEKGDPKYAPAFLAVYRRIDEILGELRQRIAGQASLVVVSDHGFCTVKKEVYLNHWLEKNGWLKFSKSAGVGLKDIEPATRAYSLTPGRIYVNLQGREPRGSVRPGADYEKVRQELIDSLTGLRDPDSGEVMIERVARREDLFSGEAFDAAPDLVALPFDGFDVKGDLNKPKLTDKGSLVGMHTYGDAILSIEGVEPRKENINITDAMPTILGLMGLPIPADLDGGALQ